MLVMADKVPRWKWWYPVPFWKVLLISLAAQLLCIIPLVALRALTGWNFPMAGAAGAGGLLMFFWVRSVAKKTLAAKISAAS
jgi:hypothetical protein